MTIKFKTLGVAMVAVLAMSAVVATAAQAQFTASSYPKSATAESALGNDKLTTEAGTVECAGHYEMGPLNSASTTVTVKITRTNCKAFGFAATVNTNGCDLVFHFRGFRLVGISIYCAIGKSIAITAGPCEMTIGGQGELGSGAVNNSGNHITYQANISGINYTVTKDGFLCPFNGTGAKTGATETMGSAVTFVPIGGGSISVD